MTKKPTNDKQVLTLDHNRQIPVALESVTSPEGAVLRAVIQVSRLNAPNLLNKQGHFRQGLGLIVDGKPVDTRVMYNAQHPSFVLEAPLQSPPTQATISLYGQPIVPCIAGVDGFVIDKAREHYALTSTELRALATSEVRQEHVPTDRAKFEGFDPKRHTQITDLHTHSSAQISAEALLGLAIKHKMTYPVELLEKLGITLDDDERSEIVDGKGFRFAPMENELPRLQCEIQDAACKVIPLEALSEEHRQVIHDHLCIPQDAVRCFSEFDSKMYRFLNPLVKNPVLAKDLILEIAKEYKKQGIQYAELSTASMMELAGGKATWFKEMIEAVDEAEAKTGVKLRFLVGIPRTYKPYQVLTAIEKIKYAARHPYIVGIDLLGYEANRTSDFAWALAHTADWARASEGTDITTDMGWDFKRDFTIRVHAGETGKNSGNVAEAVGIAEDYGVRVRIAHAVNEAQDRMLDMRIKRLSQQHTPPLVSFEFCPPSNVAYNNIQDVRDVPYSRWLVCCKKGWFLGSDGAGSIQTTATQTALTAIAGGVTLSQLEQMRTNEEHYIAAQAERDAAKTKAFKKRYGKTDPDAAFIEEFEKHIVSVDALTKNIDPKAPALPKAFEGKMPILIGGASGSSWNNITDSKTREEIEQSMRMLVASVDPAKAYFVVGRTKNEGVTAALDKVVMEHNRAYPRDKFSLLTLNTAETTDIAKSISWMVPQPGGIEQVPSNTIEFMKHTKVPGVSVFIGGENFTGHMIHLADQAGLPYLLMGNAPGASARFAAKRSEDKVFSKGHELVSQLAQIVQANETMHPIFREGVDPFNSASLRQFQRQLEQDAKQTNAREWITRVVGDSPPRGMTEDELWSSAMDRANEGSSASRPV